MTIRRTAVLAMAAGMLVAGTALAQTAPADQGPVEVLNTPGSQPAPNPVAPGAEHDWHPFSSNAMRVYMADVQTIVIDGDIRRVQVAKPPLQGAPGDYSHAVEVVEFRCAAKESRSTTEIQFGPDGTETERYDDPTAWSPIVRNPVTASLAALVCGDERSSNNVPSVKAWVDAGRKAG